jgi:cytochrome c
MKGSTMQAMLANAQWLAQNAPTQAERIAAAKHADAILAMAAAMLGTSK